VVDLRVVDLPAVDSAHHPAAREVRCQTRYQPHRFSVRLKKIGLVQK